MKRVLLFIVLGLLIGCNMNVTNTNDEYDKLKGEKVTGGFYALMLQKDYNNIDALFSKEATDMEGFNKFLLTRDELLGDIVTWKLIDWKTLRVNGTNAKVEYVFVYEAEYTKFKAVETFYMIEENNSVKIKNYNVNSDGFLNKEIQSVNSQDLNDSSK